MDLVKLSQKLKEEAGISAGLFPFGRTKRVFLKIKRQDLSKTAEWLLLQGYNQLDQLSVFDSVGVLVISYFLRSSKSNEELLLRLEEPYGKAIDLVHLSSVESVWPIASLFERLISIDFGICFEKNNAGLSGLESLEPPFLRRKANFA